jgi:hypothetical protein
MRSHTMISRTLLVGAAVALLVPGRGAAQLASASATTLGLAGNVTASARGLAAISANPAGLGMPGSSGFALAVLPFQVRPGLGPVSLWDLAEYEGEVVPRETKEEWLQQIEAKGTQSGATAAEVTAISLAVGSFGLQVSTIAAAEMSLMPDVAELLLYGNAGRTGSPVALSATGSSGEIFAISTVGGSFAVPLGSTEEPISLGATLKYSIGHVVGTGTVVSGGFTGEPLSVSLEFPIITLPEDQDPNVGSGFGVDLGFQMKQGPLGLGAALVNALNTFAWDEDKLVYRAGIATWSGSEIVDDFEERSIAEAPTSARRMVDDLVFDPTLALGASYDVSSELTVSADLQNRFGDGIELGPKFHLGTGAEFRGLRALHLRAGAAIVTGGAELAGGASLVLGPVSLSGAGGIRTGDADAQIAQLTLSFGGR